MKRRIKVTLILASLTVLVVLAGFLWNHGSTRESVDAETLTIANPTSVAALSGRGLKTRLAVDGVEFAGTRHGDHMPGELVVTWQSASGVTFRQEIWDEDNAAAALMDYHFSDPKPGVASAERDLVRAVELPPGLHADSAELFCGNVGDSRTSALEDCQTWGYWARYGQYLVYAELAGVHEPAAAMRDIAKHIDRRMPEA